MVVLHLLETNPPSNRDGATAGLATALRPVRCPLDLLNECSVKWLMVQDSDALAVVAIRSAVAAFNVGDIDGYLGHFAASCVRWIAGFDQPLSLMEIGTNMRQLVDAFSPLRLDEELLVSREGVACARWQLRGTQVADYLSVPSSGAAIDVAICEIYEVTDRVVTEVWSYQDPGQLFRQVAAGQPTGGIQ